MEFSQFERMFQAHVSDVLKDQSHLFVVGIDKDAIWNAYLDSFPAGTNEIFRQRREYDCGHCRHFIKEMGAVVVVKDNRIVTMWDFIPGEQFAPVVQALAEMVRAAVIQDVFVTKIAIHGTVSNKELTGDTITTWNHFHVNLPKVFVSNSPKSVPELTGGYRDTKNVFKRSLDELTPNSVQTVLDLIAENSLYKGEEWKPALSEFARLQSEYQALSDSLKDNFCWSKSVSIGGAVGRIRGHSIGTLLIDISAGMPIDEAVRRYEVIVAPTNYKRPKAIFTQHMIEEAKDKLTDMGLLDSLGRRHSVISDIAINNVLWANRNAVKRMGGLDVFEEMKQAVAVDPKKFEGVSGINIADFMRDIMPTATSIEALFENRHQSSLMSLIAPMVAGSPSLFKWDNSFSWAYAGNIADSMKERVKAAGGKIDGVSRFSIQWSTDEYNPNDYDAHCVEPNQNRIYYPNQRRVHPSSGVLDVDITNPVKGKVAVENITHTDIRKIQEGITEYYVHCYNHRGGTSGFDAEIELDGQIHEFSYHKNIAQGEFVLVAKVEYTKKGGFKIVESLPSTTSTRTAWALNTNQFHPVSVMMFSPNYWDGQGVGNRHYFFMLPECKNEETPNGFYNEFLKEDFMPQKHFFEALGAKMKVAPSDNQLSGLGFSSTKRESLIVRVNNSKMYKIIF